MWRVLCNDVSYLLASMALRRKEVSFLKPDFPTRVEGWKRFRGCWQGTDPSQCLSVGSWPKVLSAHQIGEKLRSRLDIFVWFETGRNALSLALCLFLVFYCKPQCLPTQRDILFSKKSWKQSVFCKQNNKQLMAIMFSGFKGIIPPYQTQTLISYRCGDTQYFLFLLSMCLNVFPLPSPRPELSHLKLSSCAVKPCTEQIC